MREVTTIALRRAPKLTLATAPTQHPPPAATRAWSAAAGSYRRLAGATDVPLVLLVAPRRLRGDSHGRRQQAPRRR